MRAPRDDKRHHTVDADRREQERGQFTLTRGTARQHEVAMATEQTEAESSVAEHRHAT
jgi:hypothetical protein